MSCADMRHLIHLDAGNDLHADQEHELAGHMERCAECRDYHSQMLKSMSALNVLRDFDSAPLLTTRPRGNSWANLASGLPPRTRPVVCTRRFNLQVAALSVCSLAMAVVTIVQALPVSSYQPEVGGVPVRLASHGEQWEHQPGFSGGMGNFSGVRPAGESDGRIEPFDFRNLPETPVNLSPVPLPVSSDSEAAQSF
jgi:hypothetical protein